MEAGAIAIETDVIVKLRVHNNTFVLTEHELESLQADIEEALTKMRGY